MTSLWGQRWWPRCRAEIATSQWRGRREGGRPVVRTFLFHSEQILSSLVLIHSTSSSRYSSMLVSKSR
jgi:hypothetical protein